MMHGGSLASHHSLRSCPWTMRHAPWGLRSADLHRAEELAGDVATLIESAGGLWSYGVIIYETRNIACVNGGIVGIDQRQPDSSSLPVASQRLDSWKEIAAYLRRDIRSVQRWEKKEGLPVYRHLHDKLGSIYAYRNELEGWFNTRQQSGAAGAVAGRQEGQADTIKLAVLPVGNLSGAREDDYFSDGLTEEMITQVTRLQASELA